MARATYSDACGRFAALWDQAEADRAPILLTQQGDEDMVLLPAAELRRLHRRATPHSDAGRAGSVGPR